MAIQSTDELLKIINRTQKNGIAIKRLRNELGEKEIVVATFTAYSLGSRKEAELRKKYPQMYRSIWLCRLIDGRNRKYSRGNYYAVTEILSASGKGTMQGMGHEAGVVPNLLLADAPQYVIDDLSPNFKEKHHDQDPDTPF
jgi:hypothetical protein